MIRLISKFKFAFTFARKDNELEYYVEHSNTTSMQRLQNNRKIRLKSNKISYSNEQMSRTP